MLESSPPNSSTPASAEAGCEPPKRLRVVLLTEEDGGDWHAGQLMKAMERRGVEVVRTSLSECAIDTGTEHGLEIPGFSGELPDGAFVRAISTGTMEQITLRLGILHALSASGVRVWNEARVIERCVDKSTASFLFHRAGLPHPTTRVVEGRDKAAAHLTAGTRDASFVVKPLFGSQGKGIASVDAPDALPSDVEAAHVFYLQHLVGSARSGSAQGYRDWRILVSGGRVVAAMERHSDDWITNIRRGSTAVPCDPSDELRDLALRAAAAVGADYAGVDLMRDANGSFVVLEINSNPAWKGLQSVSDVDIADCLASDFIARLRTRVATN